MHSHIYLDESGDLGWSFHAPYRSGGSSRYLTIGYLICPDYLEVYPKRFVRQIYKKYGFNPKKEIKATDLRQDQKEYICSETVKMLNRFPEMHLGAITVRKENVALHIRSDGNKLYNYMIKLATLDIIKGHLGCKLIRDNRSVKVASGNSCIDYLQTTLWFDYGSGILLSDHPTHSHHDDGIIFIDWITNIVWKHYEDAISGGFNILSSEISNHMLFFK